MEPECLLEITPAAVRVRETVNFAVSVTNIIESDSVVQLVHDGALVHTFDVTTDPFQLEVTSEDQEGRWTANVVGPQGNVSCSAFLAVSPGWCLLPLKLIIHKSNQIMVNTKLFLMLYICNSNN